jgi:hypothetical protein
MTAMRAIALFAIAILSCSSCSAGQRADSTFVPSVSHPAYAQSQGPRVMIDAAHRNFHTASGRYRPFAKLIEEDGYRVDSGSEKFTLPHLKKCNVLVISNAMGETESTAAFAPLEIEAVREWVRSGGSLLLIADHWPMGGAAASLSEAFGVDMCQGITEDTLHCAPSDDDPTKTESTNLVFSRENGLLADHPITNGCGPGDSIRRVVTFTGQSLGVPAGAVPFLRLGSTAIDYKPQPVRVTKADGNTQVHMSYGSPGPATGRAQGVALEFGKGRVVVLGEAAMMTAQISPDGHPFGMNLPGSDDQQLALNIVHWLSRLRCAGS